ncbi:MAG TPA: cytochrome c oxidase subunit II [Oligoflexia bacterium]|nr:cytochrome c oxidase subunit II [Oligoflexia bacterium]HMP26917.1 cytochrome c oxidase subunit II [Oligoflexia bacterium]
MFRFLPEQASNHAAKVDWLNNLITDISVACIVAICGAMLYFAFRYRKQGNSDQETPHIEGSNFLEIVWTAFPTLVCVYVAYYGVVYFADMREVPNEELEVMAEGQKWKWDFKYSNGKKTTGELVVPVGKPIKVLMTSTDVLHSFFIPAMRVKADVIPERYTYVYFEPLKTGDYHIFCTEYCGTEHSGMRARLKVVSEAEFNRWLEDDSDLLRLSRLKPADIGAELYVKSGCNACHSLDGSRLVGPSFLKLYNSAREFADGSKIDKADENYIKESVINPNAKVVKGFSPNLMPSFDGQLNADQIGAIIEFIKTLDGSSKAIVSGGTTSSNVDRAKLSPKERGELLYKEKICISCHSLDGSKVIGPSFKGLWERSGKLVGGGSYKADADYIKRSILEPQAEVVEGYPPAMPSYQGQLSDDEIGDIIEFIKSVK